MRWCATSRAMRAITYVSGMLWPAGVIAKFSFMLIVIGDAWDAFNPPPPPLTSSQLRNLDLAIKCAAPHQRKLDELTSITQYRATGRIDYKAISAEEQEIANCLIDHSQNQ